MITTIYNLPARYGLWWQEEREPGHYIYHYVILITNIYHQYYLLKNTTIYQWLPLFTIYLPGMDSGGRKRESQATMTNRPDGRYVWGRQ